MTIKIIINNGSKLPYKIEYEDTGDFIDVTKQELKSLHTKISKILGIRDVRKEMIKDMKKFIGK